MPKNYIKFFNKINYTLLFKEDLFKELLKRHYLYIYIFNFKKVNILLLYYKFNYTIKLKLNFKILAKRLANVTISSLNSKLLYIVANSSYVAK